MFNASRQTLSTLFTASILPLLGCSDSVAPRPPYKVVTLQVPRQLAGNEALFLRLAVGVLHRGQTIVIRDANGEILGSASPYGVAAQTSSVGTYTIPLPIDAIQASHVVLRLEINESQQMSPRAPTDSEIKSIELSIVPVTPRIRTQK